MEAAMTAVLGATGPLAGCVVIVFYFLQHQAKQAELNRKSLEDVVGRVEKMEIGNREGHMHLTSRFEGVVSQFRSETRETMTQLITLNRETVQTMDRVNNGVADLGQRITALSGAVGKLTDRVDLIDQYNQGPKQEKKL